MSKTATFLAKHLPSVTVSDPLSGFFAIRRSVFQTIEPRLHPTGFKILLEILANLPRTTPVAEVPLAFAMRTHGQSKLSLRVHVQFLLQILRIAGQRLLRVPFALFLLIIVVIGVVLIVRLVPLRLLFLDASVRSTVQASLKQAADEQGWLLSDVSLRTLKHDHAVITHRSHLRGRDSATCWTLAFTPYRLQPCGESSL
jgi:hypothetical protein